MRFAPLTRAGVRTTKETGPWQSSRSENTHGATPEGWSGVGSRGVRRRPQGIRRRYQLGGSLIEHAGPFQPGAILFMNLSFPGQEVDLKCRVVRLGPHRYETLASGTQNLLHRTGLEYVDILEVSHRISQWVPRVSQRVASLGDHKGRAQPYATRERQAPWQA